MIGPRSRRSLAAFFLVLAATGWAEAAKLPLPANRAPVFLVVFDLRSIEPGEITSPTESRGPIGFPISAIDAVAVVCTALNEVVLVTQLKGYVECAIGHRLSGADFNDDDAPTVSERQRAAKAIAASLVELRKSASTRAISDRGSNIVAVVLQTAEARTITKTDTCNDPLGKKEQKTVYEIVLGRKPQFTIAEVTRKSQIETDFNVLLTLASKFAAAGGARAAPPPPLECAQPGRLTTEYKFDLTSTTWSSGHPIALAIKRASVTLDAALPAIVPEPVAAADKKEATEVITAADEFLRLKALRDQEAKDLELFTTCPTVDPGRLDSLQQVVCALDRSTTASSSLSVAAVEALSKMATPRRSTFLRWAVEHKTGEARDKALVALAQIAPPAAAPAAAGEEVKQTAKFLSGPLEHWSISADVFTTRNTPFQRDDNGAVALAETPPVFYVSLNFLLGDLPSTERTFFQNIELKWLLKGSDSPFDSVGFGVGLRGSYAKRFGFDFDLLSPFVGWTWTVPEDSGRDRVVETRFGVSLNINKALEWVK
jgi:hypothetical protein